MKKTISIILSLVLIVSLFPQSLAIDTSHKNANTGNTEELETIFEILDATKESVSEHSTIDSAIFIDPVTGTEKTIQLIDPTILSKVPSSTTVTAIYTGNTMDEVLMVNFGENLLTHLYPNGASKNERLTDVVRITSVEPTPTTEFPAFDSSTQVSPTAASSDYVDNEPFEFTSSGSQKAPSGATNYSGYYALGKRGGYTYAPSLYGYLLRKNSGYSKYYAHKFDFSKGTAFSTAASIILAYLTDGGILGITLSIITAMLGVTVDNIDVNWGVTYQVNRYRWDYKINLNSYTGKNIYTFYRTRDYWKCYNSANGKASYENRGSGYYGGRTIGNSPTIEYAISQYVEENLS